MATPILTAGASVPEQVLDDLMSRGALAGAASAVYVAVLIGTWAWWTRRLQRRRDAVPLRILVTGTRGKSSTVRALHAALAATGRRVHAKTTGTAAAELDPEGNERPTRRFGRASVLEVLRTMNRALRGQAPPDALVVECMAVRPELIELVAHRMVRPDVVVLTNAQVDHLEDEGQDVTAIAASMARAITPHSLVVTGETALGPHMAIAAAAGAASATLVSVGPAAVPPDVLSRLPGLHPQNAALVLAVTRSFGIDDEVAVEGMTRSTREPGDGERWQHRIGSLDATYADLGAVNDPANLRAELDAFPWPPAGVPRIGLVVGRWDRPLRSLSFVGLLAARQLDGLVLTGGPVWQVRRALRRAGLPADRIVTTGFADRLRPVWQHRIRRLARRIDPAAGEILVLAVQNEHDPLADRVRAFFHGGRRVGTETEAPAPTDSTDSTAPHAEMAA